MKTIQTKIILFASLLLSTVPSLFCSQEKLLQPEVKKKLQQILLHAVSKGKVSDAAEAIRSGADVNELDEDGKLALIEAIDNGDFQMVEFLVIEGRADVNKPDGDGDSPLLGAAMFGSLETIEFLIAHGAHIGEINKQDDEFGYTALMMAVLHDNTEGAKFLLDHGADIDTQNNGGYTALMLAAQDGNTEGAKFLLDHGADIDKQDNDGYTALMITVTNNHPKVVELLLDRGAKTDIKRPEVGWTALMLATQVGNAEIARLLLDYGADIDTQDNDGYTALTWAGIFDHPEIEKIIKDFVVEKKLAITEEQRQKLAKEQGGLDLISTDDITEEPLDKLMILEEHLFLRKTIMDHMISKVASEEGILDPFTRKPIPAEIQRALLGHFSLPVELLEKEGPIYENAEDLQIRENEIVMAGGPETEKGKEELKELKDQAAELRKRIHDTLARYNYSYAEQ